MLRATLQAAPITTSVRLVARTTAGASGEMRETSTIDKLVQHEIANAQHCLLAQFRQHLFEISDQTTLLSQILRRCGTNICNQRCIGQVRRAHGIRNTMDKVRKVDQVTCRARNTNEMGHA